MERNSKVYRVKGFTIVEMIVVIAILGVLLGVLTPAMLTYIQKSRVQAANANAKMVYNAAQTEVQKYINIDRAKQASDASYESFKLSSGNAVWLSYDGTAGTKRFMTAAIPGSGSSVTDAFSTADNTTNVGAASLSVIDGVNRTVSDADQINWAVCIQNYIVKGAVAADFGTSRYIGCYSANKFKSMEANGSTYAAAYLDVLSSAVAEYGT